MERAAGLFLEVAVSDEKPMAFSPTLILPVRTGVKTKTRRVKTTERCPYGEPGGKLWIREKFVALRVEENVHLGVRRKRVVPCKIEDADLVCFADGDLKFREAEYRPGGGPFGTLPLDSYKWRPPMHLPRWGSRIRCEVDSIGLERVQDITEDEAVEEGLVAQVVDGRVVTARQQFRELWDVINGQRKQTGVPGFPYTWDKNPEVWVVGFHLISGGLAKG